MGKNLKGLEALLYRPQKGHKTDESQLLNFEDLLTKELRKFLFSEFSQRKQTLNFDKRDYGDFSPLQLSCSFLTSTGQGNVSLDKKSARNFLSIKLGGNGESNSAEKQISDLDKKILAPFQENLLKVFVLAYAKRYGPLTITKIIHSPSTPLSRKIQLKFLWKIENCDISFQYLLDAKIFSP